jgi:hypothetical protein
MTSGITHMREKIWCMPQRQSHPPDTTNFAPLTVSSINTTPTGSKRPALASGASATFLQIVRKSLRHHLTHPPGDANQSPRLANLETSENRDSLEMEG